MAVVADATMLIDVLRRSGAAAGWLRDQPDLPLCSELTRAEIIRGLRPAERGRPAGEFGRRYRRSYEGIAATDLIVAATARLTHGQVATHNLRHFPMFRGLRAPY